MTTVSVCVNKPTMMWQLELLWFRHSEIYRELNTVAVIIERDSRQSPILPIPHVKLPYLVTKGACDVFNTDLHNHSPLNSLLGLKAYLLTNNNDDEIIEVLDSDMFHLKDRSKVASSLGDNELICDDMYEYWHLKSKSDNKYVVEKFVETSDYYNGGWMPIIASRKTFNKIIDTWIDVNCKINAEAENKDIKWWSNMYALQIACEIHKVKMITKNDCYVPKYNDIDGKSIVHYSVDNIVIDKKKNILHGGRVGIYAQIVERYKEYIRKIKNNSSNIR